MDNAILGQSFSLLNRRGQTMITAACENLDISYSEYVVLLRLFESEGRTQEELANLLFLDKAVITRTVSQLEKKALVRREKDLRDKRMKHLYTTDLAKALEVKLTAVLNTWVEYLTENLTEAEKAVLHKGIRSATERAAKLSPRNFVELMEEKL